MFWGDPYERVVHPPPSKGHNQKVENPWARGWEAIGDLVRGVVKEWWLPNHRRKGTGVKCSNILSKYNWTNKQEAQTIFDVKNYLLDSV